MTTFVGRPSIHLICILSPRASGRMTAAAMSLCNSCNSPAVWRLGFDNCVFKAFDKLIGFERFTVDFVESRNPVVPFQQRRGFAGALDCSLVKFPDWINHRMVMRVQNV